MVLFHQALIHLKPRPRGYHLVTSEILAGIPTVVLGFFAALTVAPSIRAASISSGDT